MLEQKKGLLLATKKEFPFAGEHGQSSTASKNTEKKKKDSRMKKSKKYPLHQMTLSGTISECIKYSRKRDENPQFYRKKKKRTCTSFENRPQAKKNKNKK